MIATIGIVFVACCKARIASSPAVVTTSKAHLTYGFVVVSNDICGAVERALIAELRPPLNLTGWPNPQRRSLRALRDVCRKEARDHA